MIDYGRFGRPLGVETADPGKIDTHVSKEVLAKLNLHPAEQEGMVPVLAA